MHRMDHNGVNGILVDKALSMLRYQGLNTKECLSFAISGKYTGESHVFMFGLDENGFIVDKTKELELASDDSIFQILEKVILYQKAFTNGGFTHLDDDEIMEISKASVHHFLEFPIHISHPHNFRQEDGWLVKSYPFSIGRGATLPNEVSGTCLARNDCAVKLAINKATGCVEVWREYEYNCFPGEEFVDLCFKGIQKNDENKMKWEQLLETFFRTMGKEISIAAERGIIQKNCKPGNVLVSFRRNALSIDIEPLKNFDVDSIEDCELNINLIDFGSSGIVPPFGTSRITPTTAFRSMSTEVADSLNCVFEIKSLEFNKYLPKFMKEFKKGFRVLQMSSYTFFSSLITCSYERSRSCKRFLKTRAKAWEMSFSLALISKEHNPAFEDKSDDEKAALIEKVRKQYANDSKVKTSIHDIHEKYQKLLGKLVPAIKDKSDDAKAALIEKVRKQYTNESEGITTIQDIREKYQKLLAKLDDKKRTRRDNIFQVEIGNMTLADFYKTINDHGMTVLRLGSTEDNSMLAILWGNTNKQYTKGLKVCPYSNTCIRPKFMESPFSYVNVFNERNSNG
eukprot:TRINITY_DN612_c0_g2_i2.p1 TRINITY_DN612_c0_g2~~TRINITY_DN612_c0_g2_i2.p1  ORF type:complete len:569 (+),score=113.96 TRINITY_DN612_c0_g2_i2:670-2376(+)